MSIKGQAMSATTMKKANSMNNRLLCIAGAAAALLLLGSAHAAAPGVKGTAFTLTASPAYISQPDGQTVYSWGYACSGGGSAAPTTITPPATGVCGGVMQIPGPTLIVTEGVAFSVALTNNLPTAAGNTSILFPGLSVSSPPTGGVAGLLTQEAAPGTSVTYHLIANSPGTRAYYSGTQGDLQVEMGLYGAIIVLPSTAPAGCTAVGAVPAHYIAPGNSREADFRLAAAAYDHPRTCYDREYLFQFSEMDLNIHNQALAQVTAKAGCAAGTAGCSLEVPTEPYRPAYFMINGRSMPDDMDSNYAVQYPHQPYNGNPHMHPGEQVLIRVIGQGRWQHPFQEHGNHHSRAGLRWDFLLDRQGPELGCVWPQSCIHSGIHHARARCLCSGCQRLQHRCAHGDQLLGVVPGPQQADAGASVRRCGERRTGNPARSEPLYQRRVVRRQPLSGPGCDDALRGSDRHDTTLGHDRQLPDGRSGLCLHVALP